MQDEDIPPAIVGNGGGYTPPHVPTDETRAQVGALTSFGIQQSEIAAYLDIEPKTLRKHYRRELDFGMLHANAQVAARLFKSAVVEGVPSSIYFWLKTRAGWRETGPSEPTVAPPAIRFTRTTAEQVAE